MPTNDTELTNLHDVLDKTVTYDKITYNLNITYDLMRICTNKLKKQKDDGNIGFNSNHIIYVSKKLLVFLSLLFRFVSTLRTSDMQFGITNNVV